MTELVRLDDLILPCGDACLQITLQAPRANALEPGLMDALHRAFDALEASGRQKALIQGGRNFSSGGDVRGFAEAADPASYADQVVPPLQSLIRRMLTLPVIFASALRGAATGGAAGVVFASDLVVATPDAFVQPFFGPLGFAPDGGWTATLPELIGIGHARAWLMANQRHDAHSLQQMGLVQAIADHPVDRALTLLDHVETGSALTTKAQLWNATRRARVQAGLHEEAVHFHRLIQRPDTLARMGAFLHSRSS